MSGIIIAYDITDQESFVRVEYWLKEINKNADEKICKILVGNKSDLIDER